MLGSCTIQGEVYMRKTDDPKSWFFVQIDEKNSKIIRALHPKKVGRGYVPVVAKVGKTQWKTTVFPGKNGVYLLAIKSEVRKKENTIHGTKIEVRIDIL